MTDNRTQGERYLTQDHPDAHIDHPTPEDHLAQWRKFHPNVPPILCPKCKGWAGHNLVVNAYRLPDGMADTPENQAECDKCPAVTERDRLRAALVKHGTHATGCANQRNVGECSCGLWAALSGEPNSAPETAGEPWKVGDTWHCRCGAANTAERCTNCKRARADEWGDGRAKKASERSACKSCDHVPAPGQSLLASGNCLVCEAL